MASWICVWANAATALYSHDSLAPEVTIVSESKERCAASKSVTSGLPAPSPTTVTFRLILPCYNETYPYRFESVWPPYCKIRNLSPVKMLGSVKYLAELQYLLNKTGLRYDCLGTSRLYTRRTTCVQSSPGSSASQRGSTLLCTLTRITICLSWSLFDFCVRLNLDPQLRLPCSAALSVRLLLGADFAGAVHIPSWSCMHRELRELKSRNL